MLIITWIQQIGAKRVPDWVGEGDPQVIVQETEIRPYYSMVHAQTRIPLKAHKIIWDFEI